MFTSPDNTYWAIISLSIEVIFCVSAAIVVHKSPQPKIVSTSLIVYFISSPSALLISGTILVV